MVWSVLAIGLGIKKGVAVGFGFRPVLIAGVEWFRGLKIAAAYWDHESGHRFYYSWALPGNLRVQLPNAQAARTITRVVSAIHNQPARLRFDSCWTFALHMLGNGCPGPA